MAGAHGRRQTDFGHLLARPSVAFAAHGATHDDGGTGQRNRNEERVMNAETRYRIRLAHDYVAHGKRKFVGRREAEAIKELRDLWANAYDPRDAGQAHVALIRFLENQAVRARADDLLGILSDPQPQQSLRVKLSGQVPTQPGWLNGLVHPEGVPWS